MARKDGDRIQQLGKLNPRVHGNVSLPMSVQGFIPYYTAGNTLIENRMNAELFSQ